MPNLDYDQLATKTAVDNVRIGLRGEMAELRGEMATNMRTMVLTQLGTSVALAGFVAGVA